MNLCRQSDKNDRQCRNASRRSPSRPTENASSPAGSAARHASGTSARARELRQFRTGGQYVFAAAFSPDGKYVALGTNDRPAYLKIYDAATGNLAWEYRSRPGGDGSQRGHQDAILSVAYSRDGKRLLTSSYDNTARLWDVENREEIRVFRGHDWWVWSAAFSPDERWIVTASQDGSAIVWDAESGAARKTFRGHKGPVYTAVFAPANGRRPAAPSPLRGKPEPIPGLIASGGYDKRVILWAPEKVRKFDFGLLNRPVDTGEDAADLRLPAEITVLQGHTSGVRAVSFSDDGQLLATGSNDNTVRVWDVATGQLVKALRGHGGRVRRRRLHPRRARRESRTHLGGK